MPAFFEIVGHPCFLSGILEVLDSLLNQLQPRHPCGSVQRITPHQIKHKTAGRKVGPAYNMSNAISA